MKVKRRISVYGLITKLFVLSAVSAGVIASGLLYREYMADPLPDVSIVLAASDATQQWSLFTEQVEIMRPIQKVEPQTVAVSTNAKLVGIAADGKSRVALISQPQFGVQAFKEGMKLGNDWKIFEISTTFITLENAGKLQVLELPTYQPDKALIIPATVPKLTTIAPTTAGLSLLRSARGELAVSLAEVDPEILRELSLQPTDLVVRIDDVSAADIFQQPKDYAAMLSQNSWRVELETDGTQEVRVFPMVEMLRIISSIK